MRLVLESVSIFNGPVHNCLLNTLAYERTKAEGDFVDKPSCFHVCQSCYSHANKPVNMIINMRKTGRFLTKQGQLQPRLHSMARALNTMYY